MGDCLNDMVAVIDSMVAEFHPTVTSVDVARAILAGMREPDQEMLSVLDDNTERGKYRWQAAINVALGRPPVDSN